MKWSFIGNVLVPASSLLSAPALARGLDVEGRGQSAAALVPVALAAIIGTFGVPNAATFFVARFPQLVRIVTMKAFTLLLMAGSITTVICVILSGWLSGGTRSVADLIGIVALLIVPTMLVQLLQAVAAGMHQWRRVFLERCVSSIFKIALIYGLFLSGRMDVENATLVLAASPLVGGLAYIGRPRRTTEPIPDWQHIFSLKEMLSYSARVWVGSLSGILLARLDQALLLPLSSAEQLGLYVVAVAIAEAALISNNAIREVMFPGLSQDMNEERLARASRLSTILALVIALGSAGFAICGVPLIFGDQFVGAIPACLILIIGILVGNPGSMAGVGLSAIGRPGLRSVNLLVACGINAGLVLIFVPTYGAMGAAIATLMANLFSSNLNILSLRRQGNLRWRDFYHFRLTDVKDIWRLGLSLVQSVAPAKQT